MAASPTRRLKRLLHELEDSEGNLPQCVNKLTRSGETDLDRARLLELRFREYGMRNRGVWPPPSRKEGLVGHSGPRDWFPGSGFGLWMNTFVSHSGQKYWNLPGTTTYSKCRSYARMWAATLWQIERIHGVSWLARQFGTEQERVDFVTEWMHHEMYITAGLSLVLQEQLAEGSLRLHLGFKLKK